MIFLHFFYYIMERRYSFMFIHSQKINKYELWNLCEKKKVKHLYKKMKNSNKKNVVGVKMRTNSQAVKMKNCNKYFKKKVLQKRIK